jgi:uncharacterized membrane protein YhiD involved in acid resistance
MPKELTLLNDVDLSLTLLLLNMGVGALLSIILSWHFKRFGSTLSNREEFSLIFPMITLTTILIITVVKSSLALSLGLVGALSIVRFRTPIKEPEELAYLFITIAVGLGLGANQTIPTSIATIAILAMLALLRSQKSTKQPKKLHLTIEWEPDQTKHPDHQLEILNDVVSKHVSLCDLRRFELRDKIVDATYILDTAGLDNLSALVDDLNRSLEKVSVTFLDQSNMPTV